ncbi:acyl-(acyl-carrier-protein)--UDP-N-acetylglucosamine O-acyltransferase [Leptolyngbyaceae cyanobacterium JSC-12]|nr:acyl-(acyl-carrier-protein)--UDP-N-acetylglucosamine O-acyltransferase [Leptolyngbyaceae cyanobacterium JSC-12]
MATLIHSTAVIHPGAELHPTVEVGPYAVIGEKVKVGPETVIGAHVVLDGWTEIGARNHIFPGAAIGLASQDKKYDGTNSLVKIGDDNRIREFVTINCATYADEVTLIGDRNLIMAYTHVAHNCVIEDQVVITNAVSLGGHVHIESQARVGGMSGIHQGVRIGRLAMVGGMSRITRDVPPYTLVEGNSARVRSLNLVGLKRAGLVELDDGRVFQSLKTAFRLLYRSGLPLKEALTKLETLLDNEYIQHFHRFLQLSQQEGRRGPTPGAKVSEEDDDE